MLGKIEEYLKKGLSWVQILKDQEIRQREGEWGKAYIAVQVVMERIEKEDWNLAISPALCPGQILCCGYQMHPLKKKSYINTVENNIQGTFTGISSLNLHIKIPGVGIRITDEGKALLIITSEGARDGTRDRNHLAHPIIPIPQAPTARVIESWTIARKNIKSLLPVSQLT